MQPPTGETPRPEALSLEDVRRSERLMLVVRAIAVPWALLQVSTYTTRPYPPGVKGAGFALVAFLAAGVVVGALLLRSTRSAIAARRLGIAGLAIDILAVSGFAWLFAFDQESALWAILLIIPLEGAIRFQLTGALWTWGTVTALYAAREIWGSGRYDYRLQWDSVTFRMGIGLMIALVAGLMARDLVRQRAQLRRANADLQRIDAVRSALVTTMAHDVRNPLTAIRGTLSLLRRSDLEPSLLELVEATDHAAQRLQRLSLNLLDLARLEQGRLELTLEPVAVADVVAAAISFTDYDRVVRSEIDPTVAVLSDPERLEQVLVNLLSNALRYGDPPVTVTAARAGDMVRIAVSDCGSGIPVSRRDAMFDPFQSSENKTSVGFGLTIVKALTEASGGRVSYEDVEPRGAAFVIELPSAEPREEHRS